MKFNSETIDIAVEHMPHAVRIIQCVYTSNTCRKLKTEKNESRKIVPLLYLIVL